MTFNHVTRSSDISFERIVNPPVICIPKSFSNKLSVMDQDAVESRMKDFEAALEHILDPDKPWMVRLDGCRFSKFTKEYQKPFDARIHKAMLFTASDLLTYFCAVAAYTVSDEITLVFPAQWYYYNLAKDPNLLHAAQTFTQIYNGRVQKLASIMASYCTSRFNHYLGILVRNPRPAFFDARVFQVPSPDDVLQNIQWRAMSGMRNSKSTFGSAYLTKHQLQGLSGWQILQMVKELHRVSYEDSPKCFQGGCLLKKAKVFRPGSPGGRKLPCHRRVTVRADFQDIPNLTSELILSQNVSDHPEFCELDQTLLCEINA